MHLLTPKNDVSLSQCVSSFYVRWPTLRHIPLSWLMVPWLTMTHIWVHFVTDHMPPWRYHVSSIIKRDMTHPWRTFPGVQVDNCNYLLTHDNDRVQYGEFESATSSTRGLQRQGLFAYPYGIKRYGLSIMHCIYMLNRFGYDIETTGVNK